MNTESNETVPPTSESQKAALKAAFGQFRQSLDDFERVLLTTCSVQPEQPMMPPVHRDVMKPREYAERVRVNVRKVHTWIRRGMPHFLVEGRIRIRVAQADAWIDELAPTSAKPQAKLDAKEQKTDKRRTDKQNADKQHADKQRTDKQNADKQHADKQRADKQSVDEQSPSEPINPKGMRKKTKTHTQ